MPRALGGAPALSVQWRSLGRSLLGNAVRVRRSCGLRRVGAAQATASSPDMLLQSKNSIFLEVRPLSRLLRSKSPYRAGCCAFPDKHFKAKTWAGVVRARPPTTTVAPAKFGAGKFCRLIQRKNKN